MTLTSSADILAVRPGDLFDPGFQLSFAATLGIVVAPLQLGAIVGVLGRDAARSRAHPPRQRRPPLATGTR